MGIIQDFKDGKMDRLRSLKNSEFGSKDLYVSKDLPPSNPLNSSGFSYNSINSRTNDLGRIAKLLKDRPGLEYISNQNKLNQVDTSARIQRSGRDKGQFSLKSFAKDISSGVISGLVNTALQVGTVLAQVPVNGTGLHFINGLTPSGYLQSGASRNTSLGQFLASQGVGGGVNGAKSVQNGMPVPTNVEQRLEQLVTDERSSLQKKSIKEQNFESDLEFGTLTGTLPLPKNTFGTDYQITGSDGSVKAYTVSNVSIENKFKKTQTENSSLSADYINGLFEQTDSILGEGNDIIPFEFHRLGLDTLGDTYLYFRAFLDNFNDSYSGDWSGTRYIGRAEEFYTYQGFTRQLQFSFKIAAFSKREIDPLYRKLNLLVGTTAPSYNPNGDFMRGTLTSITIGDYLIAQKGFINSVGLNWEKGYPWEVETGDTETKTPGIRVPHILNVDIGFTPIHEFNVTTDVNLNDGRFFGRGVGDVTGGTLVQGASFIEE